MEEMLTEGKWPILKGIGQNYPTQLEMRGCDRRQGGKGLGLPGVGDGSSERDWPSCCDVIECFPAFKMPKGQKYQTERVQSSRNEGNKNVLGSEFL